jgi:hypothetical protein
MVCLVSRVGEVSQDSLVEILPVESRVRSWSSEAPYKCHFISNYLAIV